MKNHLFILLFACFFSNITSLTAQKFPDYPEVVKRFGLVYSMYPGVEANKVITFEKKPKGYFVAWKNLSTQKNEGSELFWAAETKEFLEVRGFIHGISNRNPEIQKELLHPTLVFLYDIEPYFGYPTWQEDVVTLLEKTTQRSAREDYALGKAYGVMAQRLVDSNLEDRVVTKKPIDLKANLFSLEEIDAYRNLQALSIAAKKRAAEAEPNFNTLVGLINTDYSNQVLTSYLYLRFMANPKVARQELKPDLYNIELLNHAANLLLSCPKNGILFTLGDNDTSPLMYLQERDGLRRDVSVINMALLSNGAYANHFRKPIFDEMPVELSAKPEFYAAGTDFEIRPYLLNSDTMEMKDWMLLCMGRTPTFAGTKAIYVAPSKYIKIPIGGSTIWMYGMDGTIYANNMFILDAITSNRDKRPLSFTAAIQLKEYLPLVPFLSWEGLVYSLVQQKSINSVDPKNPVVGLRNLALGDSLINHVFRWTDEVDQNHDHGQQSYISYTQYLCYEVARQHNAQGVKSKACAVAEKYFSHYPTIGHDDIALGYYLWMEYQKCTSDKENARKIVETLTDALESVPPGNWYYYKTLAESLHKELVIAGWNDLASRIAR